MTPLRAPKVDGNPGRNWCAQYAISALTGESVVAIREGFFGHLTRSKGTPTLETLKVLRALGCSVAEADFQYWREPLHLVLARLRGRKAYIVTRSGHHHHAIAAEGFMISDSFIPRPHWFGDRLFGKRPRPRKVVKCFIIGGA